MIKHGFISPQPLWILLSIASLFSSYLVFTPAASQEQPKDTSPNVSIAIDKFNNIFVGDSSNHKIQKFDKQGKFLDIGGSTGTGNGQFSGEIDLSVDQDGNVFVVDNGSHKVQQFDGGGSFVRSWKY